LHVQGTLGGERISGLNSTKISSCKQESGAFDVHVMLAEVKLKLSKGLLYRHPKETNFPGRFEMLFHFQATDFS
jgi:hypothetical protein